MTEVKSAGQRAYEHMRDHNDNAHRSMNDSTPWEALPERQRKEWQNDATRRPQLYGGLRSPKNDSATEVLAPPVGEVLKPVWSAARNLFVRHAETFCNATRYEEASAIADQAAREFEEIVRGLAAPTVQVGEDLGSISAQEAEIPTASGSDVSSQGEGGR